MATLIRLPLAREEHAMTLIDTRFTNLTDGEADEAASELSNMFHFGADGPFAVRVNGRPSESQLEFISDRLRENGFNENIAAVRVIKGGYSIYTHAETCCTIDDLI